MPPKNLNKKADDVIPELSIHNTIDLLSDIKSRKKFMEDIIGQMKNFNPTFTSPISPQNRHSPRLNVTNPILTGPSAQSKKPEQLDMSIVFQQMSFLYETNVKLVEIINDMRDKYEKIDEKNDCLSNEVQSLRNNIEKNEKEIQSIKFVPKVYETTEGDQDCSREDSPRGDIRMLENKLANLEQCQANKYIVFQGSKIDELINSSGSDNKSLKQVLKNYFSNVLEQNSVQILEEILSVKIYGRVKKIIKAELSNNITKGKIISVLKRQRPTGVYISEFLIPTRLKLFHDVRLFAKANNDKIDKVFTRNGLIYYRLKTSGQISLLENELNLLKLKQDLAVLNS